MLMANNLFIYDLFMRVRSLLIALYILEYTKVLIEGGQQVCRIQKAGGFEFQLYI